MRAIILDEDWGDPADWCLDAGLSAKEPRGEVRFTDYDLMTASPEDLNSLLTLVLYSNQYWRREEDIMTRDLIIMWKYVTPCITDLEESK